MLAPTINVQVTTDTGQTIIDSLPDSGADICAAGPQLVSALRQHMDNLAKSDIAQ